MGRNLLLMPNLSLFLFLSLPLFSEEEMQSENAINSLLSQSIWFAYYQVIFTLHFYTLHLPGITHLPASVRNQGLFILFQLQ